MNAQGDLNAASSLFVGGVVAVLAMVGWLILGLTMTPELIGVRRAQTVLLVLAVAASGITMLGMALEGTYREMIVPFVVAIAAYLAWLSG